MQIIKICLSLSIYINYALSNYVAFKTIWDELKPLIKNDKYNAYFKNLLRTITVILTSKYVTVVSYTQIKINKYKKKLNIKLNKKIKSFGNFRKASILSQVILTVFIIILTASNVRITLEAIFAFPN